MSHQTKTVIRRGTRRLYHINDTDTRNPEAGSLCDGCQFPVRHKDLYRQMEYRGGAAPVWTGWLVCGVCLDKPNPYFARQVLLPDPIPVLNPRPDQSTGSTSNTYTSYASGSLPRAFTFPAGYQITVTGGSLPGRAYADGQTWRNVETGEVTT